MRLKSEHQSFGNLFNCWLEELIMKKKTFNLDLVMDWLKIEYLIKIFFEFSSAHAYIAIDSCFFSFFSFFNNPICHVLKLITIKSLRNKIYSFCK